MKKNPFDKESINLVREPNPPSYSDKRAKLEEDKYFNQSRRDEATKKHVHIAIIAMLWVTFSAFSIVFLIRIIHLIIPLNYHWLDANQLQGIDKLIFSGAIGGFIGRNLNSMFGK